MQGMLDETDPSNKMPIRLSKRKQMKKVPRGVGQFSSMSFPKTGNFFFTVVLCADVSPIDLSLWSNESRDPKL